MTEPGCPYVSRGGIKLAAALDAFGIQPAGWVCADLGSNVGGFVDCLLQRGAAHVFAVDTGYGQFAWTLRNDARVTVLERTNALYFDPWRELETGAAGGYQGCQLVTIDLGWTRQARAVPAALGWLGRGASPGGLIISLIKPHYEAERSELARGGVLAEVDSQRIARRALDAMPDLNVEVLGIIRSPILGGAGKGKKGNVEYLALLKPVT